MTDNLRIRRDHSALSDGTLFGRRRRTTFRWKFGLWALVMAFAGGIMWQFDRVQPTVLALISDPPTATPSNLTYTQAGYTAYLHGDLETAINNYCLAAHGVPDKPFSAIRCALPDLNSSYAKKPDVNVTYELVRVMVYRTNDDRRLNIYNQNAEDWGHLVAAGNPRSSRALSIYSYSLYNNYKADQAIPAGISGIDPNNGGASNGDAYAFLSDAEYEGNRYSDALNYAEKAVSLDNNSVDAHIALANALFFNNQFSSAEGEFLTATKINPFLEFPYFSLAAYYLYQKINRPEDAIAAYNTVLTIDNKSAKAYTRKCAAYLNQGDTTNALGACKNATTLDDQFAEAWKWQGQVLYNRRDYEDALTSFKKCRDLEDDSVAKKEITPQDRLPECWYLGGLAYYTLDDGRNHYCEQYALKLFNEVLTFSKNAQVVRLTSAGFQGCASVNPNLQQPTPVPPTPTLRPPIT